MPPKKATTSKTSKKVKETSASSSMKKDKPATEKKTTKSKNIEDTNTSNEVIPIILESPNKIKKILTFLPRGKYILMASCGHFRELTNGGTYGIGIDVDEHRTSIDVLYEPDSKKKSIIANLKAKCKTAKTVYLATDPDREGEAIAWHITELLGRKKDYYRVKFHSITRGDVLKALEAPEPLDMNLVLAQQTRKIMDKWIGWKVSPLCWTNVSKLAKSAGRVQSPALKLIVHREREIIAFKQEEYFTLSATFNVMVGSGKKKASPNQVTEMELSALGDAPTPITFKTEDECMSAIGCIETESASGWTCSITPKETYTYPPPPYTTLTLLQDCHYYLRYSPEYSMTLLQKMYEQGWITYHRTDSVVLSPEGLFGARGVISETWPHLATEKPRNYTNKSLNAQEAHEPIRPTHFEVMNLERDLEEADRKMEPEFFSKMAKVYSLIYFRTIASQCKPVTHATISVVCSVTGTANIQFKRTYSTVKDWGWKQLYDDGIVNLFTKSTKEKESGTDAKDAIPEWIIKGSMNETTYGATAEEFGLETHHTRPPPYFTPSTLIKELETLGIGRPSTYAHILAKLKEHKYTYEESGKIHPTEVGCQLADFLERHYNTHFMDLKFTQRMESELDEIAEGKKAWTTSVFYFIDQFPMIGSM